MRHFADVSLCWLVRAFWEDPYTEIATQYNKKCDTGSLKKQPYIIIYKQVKTSYLQQAAMWNESCQHFPLTPPKRIKQREDQTTKKNSKFKTERKKKKER